MQGFRLSYISVRDRAGKRGDSKFENRHKKTRFSIFSRSSKNMPISISIDPRSRSLSGSFRSILSRDSRLQLERCHVNVIDRLDEFEERAQPLPSKAASDKANSKCEVSRRPYDSPFGFTSHLHWVCIVDKQVHMKHEIILNTKYHPPWIFRTMKSRTQQQPLLT